MSEDGSLGAVERFGKKINTKFHEDTPAFTKDGKQFTLQETITLTKEVDLMLAIVTLLKIYSAKVDKDGNWNNITALPFNSDSYQTAHPALSSR
ncbi:hypothetical protein [Flavobacterium sp. N1994]|uniref:hypothetical protein n=1 Tax=Flavobacterium sp. N1994 TaxID=2986827 RepID=UPI0022212F33|nr:hypothetical protein [Flavobacterium sp. N1994]